MRLFETVQRGKARPGSRGRHLALELLYPRRCPLCHDIAPAGRRICPECEAALPLIRTARCKLCSRPVGSWERLCRECRGHPRYFDRGFGVYAYDERMRRSVTYLKYKGRREYGETLGRCMAEAAADVLAAWQVQAVVPVPLHKSRLAVRGYNQAEALARPVAEFCGAPLLPDSLQRTGKTSAMKRLGAEERRRNLAGAFFVKRGAVLPRRVLLVDDIFTTGATASVCATALKNAGVRRVFFLALCIGESPAAQL